MGITIVLFWGAILLLGGAALHGDIWIGSGHGVRHSLVGFAKGWWRWRVIACAASSTSPSHWVHWIEKAGRRLQGQRRRACWWGPSRAGTQALVLLVLLVLHASVLEPDLDLAFWQVEQVGHFHASWPAQVPVEMELLLQLNKLGTGICCSSPLRWCWWATGWTLLPAAATLSSSWCIARVVAGWTVFLLSRLTTLFHPGKNLLGQGWVGRQWRGWRRCGRWCRRGRSRWLIGAWFREWGGPSTATRLLSPSITVAGVGGKWRGHLGARVVLRWQTGPHAAAIQLLGLG